MFNVYPIELGFTEISIAEIGSAEVGNQVGVIALQLHFFGGRVL